MIIIIMIAEQTQIPFQGFDTGYIWVVHGLYMGYQQILLVQLILWTRHA